MVVIAGIISTMALQLKHVVESNLTRASYVTLHKLLLHFYNHLKQLYISSKTGSSVIKVSVAYVYVPISRCLKQELAWATDKLLWVISNIMLFKTVIPLRNLRIKLF